MYGTQREAGANRYAAEQMQAQFLDQFESQVPIYKDFEVTDELLAHNDVIFVGRPEANTALAAWAKQIGLDYQAAMFKIDESDPRLRARSADLSPRRIRWTPRTWCWSSPATTPCAP